MLVIKKVNVVNKDKIPKALELIKNQEFLQIIDAKHFVSKRFVEYCFELLKRRISRRELITENKNLEFLLYLARTNQIKNALEIGINKDTKEAIVIGTDAKIVDKVVSLLGFEVNNIRNYSNEDLKELEKCAMFFVK